MDKYTKEQLLQGANNAIAAGDLAAAKELLEAAKALDVPQATSGFEQGMSGLNEGLANAIGAPVDLVSKGLGKIGLPQSDMPIGGSESIKGLFQMISGDSAISDAEPQTMTQRVLRRGGQEVGAAIPAIATMAATAPAQIAGAAPTIVNAGRNLWAEIGNAFRASPTRTVGSEAATAAVAGAGAATAAEMFPDNPTAEMIGQVVGSLGGSLAANTVDRLTTILPKGPKSPAELKQAAGVLFDDIRTSGISFPGSAFGNTALQARAIAKAQGILLPNGRIDPDYTKVQGVLNILDLYRKSNAIDPATILATRQGIADRARDAAGTSEAVILRRILKEFDDETSALAPQIKAANAMYQRASKGETLEELLSVARINAGQYSQSGMENAVRTQFRGLARAIAKGDEVGWTPEEVSAINQIAAGGTLDNALRFVGKFAPRGVVSFGAGMGTIFSGVMAATRDPYVSAAAAGTVGGTGLAANFAAGALQERAVKDLVEKIISGRPLSDAGKERMRAALTAYFTSAGVQSAAAPEQDRR